MDPIKAYLAKRQLRFDYIDTFSSAHGQRVMADILLRSGVTRPVFHSDPMVTQFHEGHRHLAMSIFRQAHYSPDILPGLMTEDLKRQEESQKENSKTS